MIIALLAASSVLAATPYPDPIGPAASGQMQCHAPNTVKKTCESLATYKAYKDGTYINRAIVLLSSSPEIIMDASSPVYIRDKAVCGVPRIEDLSTAKLSLNGRVLSEAESVPLRKELLNSMSGIIGREICTIYIEKGANLTARAYIDGVARPELDQYVKWVTPDEGYSVSP